MAATTNHSSMGLTIFVATMVALCVIFIGLIAIDTGTLLPMLSTGLFLFALYLFYRLVVAVEHIAYES